MALNFIIGTTSDSAVLFSFAGFEELRDAGFLADFTEPFRRDRGFPDFAVCGSSVEFAKKISDWLAIVNLPYSILFGLELPLVAHGVPLDEDDPFSDLSTATIYSPARLHAVRLTVRAPRSCFCCSWSDRARCSCEPGAAETMHD